MYTFTRSQVRLFRAAVRKARVGRRPTRLVIAGLGGRYALQFHSDAVSLDLAVTAPCGLDRFGVPPAALAACEGRGDDPVTFERDGKTLLVSWLDGAVPVRREFDLPADDDLPAFPERPAEMTENDPGLWKALADAVATSGERSRLALDCLQLRGEGGRVAATDAYQVLLQSGFSFPWSGDALVPALPLLGCRELDTGDEVSVGRCGEVVFVAAGPWTLALKVESGQRYPDVDRCVPGEGSIRSRLTLSEDDARFLAANLAKLPGGEEPHRPVTVELDGRVAVRAKATGGGEATELVLSESTRAGEPLLWRSDRRFLARAAALGFREWGLTGAETPVVCGDGGRRFAWAPLAAAGAVPPDAVGPRVESAAERRPSPAGRRRRAAAAEAPCGTEGDGLPPTALLSEGERLRGELERLLGELKAFLGPVAEPVIPSPPDVAGGRRRLTHLASV